MRNPSTFSRQDPDELKLLLMERVTLPAGRRHGAGFPQALESQSAPQSLDARRSKRAHGTAAGGSDKRDELVSQHARVGPFGSFAIH
jgi:hypothetical protein